MAASVMPPLIGSVSSMFSTSEKTVRQSPYRTGHSPVVARTVVGRVRTDVAEPVNDYLRARHPAKTADHVAAVTGIPAGTVQKWLDRGSAPSARHFCCLIAAYGPGFLISVFTAAPEWLDEDAREQRATELKSEIAALEAKLAGVGHG